MKRFQEFGNSTPDEKKYHNNADLQANLQNVHYVPI